MKSLHQKLVAILPRVSNVGNTGESQSPSPKDKIYISFPKMHKTGAFYLVRRRQVGNLFFASLFKEEKSPRMKPIKLVTSDGWERRFYCYSGYDPGGSVRKKAWQLTFFNTNSHLAPVVQ